MKSARFPVGSLFLKKDETAIAYVQAKPSSVLFTRQDTLLKLPISFVNISRMPFEGIDGISI